MEKLGLRSGAILRQIDAVGRQAKWREMSLRTPAGLITERPNSVPMPTISLRNLMNLRSVEVMG